MLHHAASYNSSLDGRCSVGLRCAAFALDAAKGRCTPEALDESEYDDDGHEQPVGDANYSMTGDGQPLINCEQGEHG